MIFPALPKRVHPLTAEVSELAVQGHPFPPRPFPCFTPSPEVGRWSLIRMFGTN